MRQPRKEPLPERRDHVHDPTVALAAVHPGRDRAPGAQLRDERVEPTLGVGQVVQHADREGVVEHPLDRRSIDVRLDDVRVLEVARVGEGRINGFTQVERHHTARAELRRERSVPALAAATLQHCAVTEEFRRDRPDPIEELPAVALGQLRVARPLVAERLRGARLDLAQQGREPRHAAHDRIAPRAAGATELAGHDLRALPRLAAQHEVLPTGRADQHIEQRRLHRCSSSCHST